MMQARATRGKNQIPEYEIGHDYLQRQREPRTINFNLRLVYGILLNL